jgi:hypothetical protein
MHTLKSIGVMSCAKIMGATYGAIGLLLLPFIVIVGGVGALTRSSKEDFIAAITMLAFGILAPVFYGAMGFVMGALSAFLYNLFAKWVGGVQLELQSTSFPATIPPQA